MLSLIVVNAKLNGKLTKQQEIMPVNRLLQVMGDFWSFKNIKDDHGNDMEKNIKIFHSFLFNDFKFG